MSGQFLYSVSVYFKDISTLESLTWIISPLQNKSAVEAFSFQSQLPTMMDDRAFCKHSGFVGYTSWRSFHFSIHFEICYRKNVAKALGYSYLHTLNISLSKVREYACIFNALIIQTYL